MHPEFGSPTVAGFSQHLGPMHHLLRGYWLALIALLFATLVRWLLDPYVGLFVAFPTYFVAVALVGLFAGLGPALLTMVAGGLIADQLFLPSRDLLLMSEREHWVSLALFYASSSVMIAMGNRLRASRSQLVETIATANDDLARRKDAEQSARDSEARLQAIIDNSPLVIFIKDVQGRYLLANRSYFELFDTTPEQLIGITDFDRFPSEVAESYWQNDLQVIRTGRAREFEEHIELDRRSRTFVSNKFPLYDESGIVYAVCGISMEITEQKRQQEELLEIDRRKDQFLSMLAHELRNPLAPIVTAVEVLRHAAADAPTAGRAIEVIARQARHLTLLVDDLLDIARINTGRIKLRRDLVELGQLVQQAVDSARPRFEGRQVALEAFPANEPLMIVADAARITQVIDNLLDNACKYTDAGGHVYLSLERDGDTCMLRVRDTGIGLELTHLERVFELFEQVDASLDRSAGGLGLGLNLVKRIVEKHGGTVSASSGGLGHGSEFVVCLPLTEGAPHSGDAQHAKGGNARPAPPARAACDKRVLVVEDNLDAAQSLQMLLETLGYAVRVAADGRTAVAAAEVFEPHVVLLDLGLPEMDGYAVARALRKRFGDAVRLVAVTGYGHEEYLRRSKAAGFDEHVVKPPTMDVLERVLSSS
jgi:PAS domain S-box-containing protein